MSESNQTTTNIQAECDILIKPELDLKKTVDEEEISQNIFKYCRSCKKMYKTRGSYRRHIRRRHMPNPDIQPDPNHPNHYCSSCNIIAADKHRFYIHLRDTHSIYVSINRRRKETVPLDPNNYCETCKFKYLNKSSFRSHLASVHKMSFGGKKVRDRNPAVPPDPEDPNFYCRSCDYGYSSKNSFQNHLRNIHDIEIKKKSNPFS